MSRFYIPPESIKGNVAYIKGEEAHHIADVMRLKKRDRISAFDGKGREYDCILKDVTRNCIAVEITNTRDIKTISRVDITLAQAIPKKAKIDFIIEKATELGVQAIIPLQSARTIVKFNREKKDSKRNRWERIALSASKQCGRLDIPVIHPMASFTDVVKKTGNYELALMACLHRESQNLKDVICDLRPKSTIVFIGPEGDFTEQEIKTARDRGCRLVSLGPRVLRVDTAAINILSALQYELG